jgi:hypothetical protein
VEETVAADGRAMRVGLMSAIAAASFLLLGAGIFYDSVSVAGHTGDGLRFSVTMEARAFGDSGRATKGRVKSFLGVDEGDPLTVVSRCEVTIGGRSAPVPTRAIADLANPILTTMSVSGSGSKLTVSFHGGDGAGAYEAKLEFTEGALRSREIGEFDSDGEWVTRLEHF